MEHGTSRPVNDRALLTDPQEFEEYLSRVSGLLQSRWSERVSFLESAVERLQALADDAVAVRDDALAEQLRGHSHRAIETLESLRAAGPFVGTPNASAPVTAASGQSPEPAESVRQRVDEPERAVAEMPAARQPEVVVPLVPDPSPAIAAPGPLPTSAPDQDWHSVLQRFWTAPAAPADSSDLSPEEMRGTVPNPVSLPEASPPLVTFFGADPTPVPTPPAGEPVVAEPVVSQATPAPSGASLPPTLGWDLDIKVDPAPVDSPPPAPSDNGGGPAPLRLQVASGERQTEWCMEGEIAVIGRRDAGGQNRPELDLFPDQAVSRRHAQIARRRDGYFFVDLGSANGTQVNGQILAPHAEHRLAEGDEILIGELTTLVVLPAAPTR